ncbi:MAG TPA: exopolysaccharide biosynthesis protein [Kofleriaceae bacterium]
MDVIRARETIAAEKPRRLRLDELLRELGADDERDSAPPLTGDGDAPPQLANGSDGIPAAATGVTVGELIDKAAEAGFGFSIGVLALIAIPFFGLSTPFGLAIALLGAQLAVGKQRPWLPARVRRRHLSMSMLDRVLRLFTKRTRWLARSTTRRWEMLITPRAIGFAVTLLGLGLALPLPIPGSNMIFLVPILVYSIALLERDGLWSAIGHVGTLIDMTLLVAFGATVVSVLERTWHWLT